MTKKAKKIVKISVLSVVAFLLVCAITLYVVAVSIYKGSFDYRCETSTENTFTIEQFPSMKRERHTFRSNRQQQLVGYLYESADETQAKKGVVVFAHGLGAGGQRGYMDIFDSMTSNGYYVFAYDATANDESEGEVVGGLPQGYIDLDYALSYAKTLDELQSLPVLLAGYSWGGLSVANVLNYHPDVAAVASLAGWDKSMNLIEYRGCQMVGDMAKLLLPFGSLYEWFTYGKYAFSTAMKGFANSDCRVMIVHSEDDTTIPIGYGYDAYYKTYGNDPRFTFKRYTDRNHGVLQTSEGELDRALIEEIVRFFDESIA